jgi:hypothetical protein
MINTHFAIIFLVCKIHSYITFLFSHCRLKKNPDLSTITDWTFGEGWLQITDAGVDEW